MALFRDDRNTTRPTRARFDDVVIYSLTRSNGGGQVGFLSELRRVNVAITRARERLIPVGDFSTLIKARDAGFRRLASELSRTPGGMAMSSRPGT